MGIDYKQEVFLCRGQERTKDKVKIRESWVTTINEFETKEDVRK